MPTEMRRLGATDLRTPPMILGGNVFGWTVDKAEGFRILDAWVDRGGTMIDTADMYSAWVKGHDGGESEAVLGEWLRQSGKRDRVLLATKVGMLPGDGGEGLRPARIAAAAEASLRRLGTDRIDLYYAHQDDETVPQAEYLAAFHRLVADGKVRTLGASNFHAARLREANDTALREGLTRFHVLQPEYNLVRRDRFEGELQSYAIEHNLGVAPYFGLAAGFLTGKYRRVEDASKSARGIDVAELLEGSGGAVLEAMDAVAAETDATLAQIALAWLAAQPGVTAPIASATSVAQLEELTGAWELALTTEQVDRLNTAGVRTD